MNSADLEELVEYFEYLVMHSTDKNGATAKIERIHGAEVAQEVREAYERICSDNIIEMREPTSLEDHRHISTWYRGPDFPGAKYWPSYRDKVEEKGWSEEALQSIDDATTKIVANLPNPRQDILNGRGLVLGYVQSGKTANYSGVIAKAADAGYKLFIVLAGMTNSLRNQTQRRLERELRDPNRELVEMLTSSTSDFTGAENPDFYLNPDNENDRIIAVVKKNVFVLDKLISFFKTANSRILRETPVLIIDDEADQASINTKSKASERSATNDRLVTILKTLPKVAYVGYTATPFANIFIDPTLPDDLYPRDFMLNLPRPKHYYGAEMIFGREALEHEEESHFEGFDIVRHVSEEETTFLQPPTREERDSFQPEMVPSLRSAIHYFWMATADRLARGHEDHSSMLLHTTLYTDVHDRLEEMVNSHIQTFRNRLSREDASLISELRKQWEEERRRVTVDDVEAGFSQDVDVEIQRPSFEDVFEYLPEVLDRNEVVVDNGRNEGLDYTTKDDDQEQIVIAIGGNTLSRGLTLEGLLVSYFIRTASAYDTLLQMGRWFGYRIGYEDLPRVWMTKDLEQDFFHLSTVEEELRDDIARYEKLQKTPQDFGVRVRTHPNLNVTSRLKMQEVKLTSASFSSSHVQTFLFNTDDSQWLGQNIEATRNLIFNLTPNHEPTRTDNGRWFFHDVKAEHILEFLDKYSVVKEHSSLHRDLVTKYIKQEIAGGSLSRWNIGIFGTDQGNRSRIELGLGSDRGVGCVVRTRMSDVEPANIKALTSARDRISDLNVDISGYPTRDQIFEARQNEAPNHGFLMIYPIDKDSASAPDSKREALNAEEHVIGIGLMFPESVREQSDYVANALKDVFDGSALEEEIPEEEDVRAAAAEEGGVPQ